jgi:hypothetical protein
VANPASGNWNPSGTANWYQDPNDVTSWGSGVGPTSSDNTEIFLGGNSTHASYTATETTNPNINSIYFQGTNPNVVDTLAFQLAGSTHIAMGTGTASPVMQMDGSTSWAITDPGGATAPLRFNNSPSVTGAGSGTLDIVAEMSNVSGAENFTVNETGGATIILAAANLMGGSGKAFTLTNGTVDFQNTQGLGSTSDNISLNGGALESTTGLTLKTYSGGVTLGGAVTFSGGVNWSLGSNPVVVAAIRAITADTGGTTGATIGGPITGAAGGLTLTSASTGILTLTNAGDTYGGATTINGGTLLDNGDITASSVSVGASGTLGGNGTIGVAAQDGGTLAPGATSGTIGTLNFLGGLTMTGNSAAYDADVDNAGSSDLLAVTGNLDLGTGSTLNVNVLDSTSGLPYTIATYSGTLAGTFASLNLPAGYSVDYGTGSNSEITLIVPEPGSVAMLCVVGIGLMHRRRRARN